MAGGEGGSGSLVTGGSGSMVAGGGSLMWPDVGSVVAEGDGWWSARRSTSNWSLSRISSGRLEDVNPILRSSTNIAL